MTIITDWVQAAAGVATLGAAIVAARIAAKGPERSARFAEIYRQESKASDDRDALRRGVFIALARGRRQIMHAETIVALNLIDVAFINSSAVRQAYKGFLEAADKRPFDPTSLVERFHQLIYEAARDLGLSDRLTLDDIRGGYYPEAAGRIDAAALADAEEKIAKQALARFRARPAIP